MRTLQDIDPGCVWWVHQHLQATRELTRGSDKLSKGRPGLRSSTTWHILLWLEAWNFIYTPKIPSKSPDFRNSIYPTPGLYKVVTRSWHWTLLTVVIYIRPTRGRSATVNEKGQRFGENQAWNIKLLHTYCISEFWDSNICAHGSKGVSWIFYKTP